MTEVQSGLSMMIVSFSIQNLNVSLCNCTTALHQFHSNHKIWKDILVLETSLTVQAVSNSLAFQEKMANQPQQKELIAWL